MSIGRAFQGAGVGLLIPNAMAMITTSYPVGRERIKALANLGGSGTTSSVVGFLLGGAVGTRIGWEWLFYLMAIYAVLVAGLCLWIIPPGLRDSDNSNIFNAQHASKRIDVLGMAMFVAGTVMIIYYLGESPDSGWAAAKTLPFLIAGVLLLVIFTVIEFKVPYPIVPPRIWASRRFTAAAASALFVNASGNIFSYFLSVFFQMVWNYEPMKTGISFIPSGIGMIISVELTTILLEYRVQSKILLLIGYALLGVSAILLTFMDESFAYWRFPFPALIVHAVGLGPVWVCTQVNAAADAHSSDQGIVASEYNMALQLGNPLGIALAIAFSDRVVSDVDEIQGAELVKAFRVAFYVAAAMAALGFLVTLFLAPNRDAVGIAERRDSTADRDDHDAIEMQNSEDNNITGSTAVAKPDILIHNSSTSNNNSSK
ncbi:hypothetical protein BGW42_001234 [Actinomortierella wolfii]|nr:hypothetical protein BGW42_001234 [Actinomortierella wolfii]